MPRPTHFRPLHLAARYGAVDYIHWKLLHDLMVLRDDFTALQLLSGLCMDKRQRLDVAKTVPYFSMVLSNVERESVQAFP
jgi:hypothetical protein